MVAIKCLSCLRKDSSDSKKQPDCANCPNPEIKFFDAFEAKNLQLAFKHNDIMMDYIRYKVNSPLYKRVE